MQEQNKRADLKRQQYLYLIYDHKGWNDVIKPNLEKITNKALSSAELIDKLKEFNFVSNTHREKKRRENYEYKYKQLQSQYKNEMPELFSNMAKLILQYETKQSKFAVFYAGTPRSFTYTKKEILLLSSMMSLNLIPNQDFRFSYRFPDGTDFKWIFSEEDCKTTTIVEYLKHEFKSLATLGPKYDTQKLTLKRYVVNSDLTSLIEKYKNSPMIMPTIGDDKESIEEYFGEVKVDFANKFIGGGSFHTGCVQEQIMFINHPQMYSSALVCQMMRENEAIEFIGYKKYFKNSGYAWTTAYDGFEDHKYEYDQENRAKERIVAIDALHFPSKKSQVEFSPDIINRELLKAYAGFAESGTKESKIVSGNWGCGAFNGDIPLKFFIQWLASSMAGKQLVYIPFGAKNKVNQKKINNAVSKMTVGQVYKLLMESPEQLQKSRNVFAFLQSKLGKLGLL